MWLFLSAEKLYFMKSEEKRMERPANDGTGGQIKIYTQSKRAYLGPNIQIRNALNVGWSEKATWCGWWWVNGKHRGGHPGDTVSLG